MNKITHKLTPEKLALMQSLLGQGKSYAAVGREVGLTGEGVAYQVKKGKALEFSGLASVV